MATSYGAATANGTASVVLASNNNRKSCIVFNNGGATLYVGFDSSVTTTTGMPVAVGGEFDSSNLYASWRGAIWMITDGTSVNVRYMEWEQ